MRTQQANIQPLRKTKLYRFIVAFAVFLTSFVAIASSEAPHGEEKKGFQASDAGAVIMHHIMDAHEIHIATFGEHSSVVNGTEATHLSIPLPVILYNSEKEGADGFMDRFDVFMSSKFHHGHEQYKGYVIEHEKIYYVGSGEVQRDEEGHIANFKPLDLSITKTVAGMFVGILIMLWLFVSVARAYKKREGMAPSGVQSLLEPLIIFVRDELAKPSIGKKYERFMPFLLTVFFFIWVCNMLGLIPFFGFNVTGNIAVALVLALFTFVITIKNGNKDYWMHILWTPGVPWWLKFPVPLMLVIEFLGFISKPVVLMLRLFANITAGHIVILSFVSLIFIFNSIYGAGAGGGVSVMSVAFSIFMFVIELLVAFLQAYVFTLLSAIYFGMAVEEHEHAH